MPNIAVIFAGGTGQRMDISGTPKQFLEVHEKPILAYTVEHFQRHNEIDGIYVVCLKDYISQAREIISKYTFTKVNDIVAGGSSAMDSIYIGIKRAREDYTADTIVLIHDGVRPLISKNLITSNINTASLHGNAVTCVPCSETVITTENDSSISYATERSRTYRAVAPQTFKLGEIIKLHENVRRENSQTTYDECIVDCATLCVKQGIYPHIVLGNTDNIKITVPEDYYIFTALIEYKEAREAIGC